MELKKYQKRVIADLTSYLRCLTEVNSLSKSYETYWGERQVRVGSNGIKAYQNIVDGVPHVCYKVPTGGGKTLLACASLQTIFSALPPTQRKAVVWLVPSDSILTQTLAALKNPLHPYRQKLNADFAGRVEVYSKDELLAGQNFSPSAVSDQLSVMVLSYDSFRTANKEGRKAYQPNGALEPFRGKLPESDRPISQADETALFEVINRLNPVVVVDESHHARSNLSLEMLSNFNPAFVLDLTATPTASSNIISYVDALALKAEHMVKLPVVVYNRASQTEVITDAIDLRNTLEQAAEIERAGGGDYIRPIVLFQAQPKISEDATSFEKLKTKLVATGIPAEQIAIKTASVDELKGVDLLTPDCPIRYIITVNALKEGWDCPFAYVLASLANRTSRVDVEQILGRILRQPHVHKHAQGLLNMSYVLASSVDFQQTVDDVVAGLNAAGFTAKDYRIAEHLPLPEPEPPVSPKPATSGKDTPPSDDEDSDEEFLDFDPEQVAENTNTSESGSQVGERSASMVEQATELGEEYEQEAQAALEESSENTLPADVEEKATHYSIVEGFRKQALALRIPQFYYQVPGALFDGDEDITWALLSPEHLTSGFSLKGKDSTLDVSRATEDMVAVDVSKDNADRPKAFNMNKRQQQELLKYLESLPTDGRRRQACEAVFTQLDKKNNQIASGEIKTYVQRIVENLDSQQLKMLETAPLAVARQVREKIDVFLTEHRAQRFNELLTIGKIEARPEYQLPERIHPVKVVATVGGSLYEDEGDMNDAERDLAMRIAALDNVLWWHRINERAKGAFFINGAFRHYPDFLVATKSGKIIAVESKGEMLKNDDSRQKIELGRQWASASGAKFRYFMVFKDGVTPLENAYTASQFLSLLEQL